MVSLSDIALLRCPACKSSVTFQGGTRHGHVVTGKITCARCGFLGTVSDGLPDMHREAAVGLPDRLMRLGYDCFSRQHDLGLRYYLPLLQDLVTEDQMRAVFLSRLHLRHLRRRKDGQPLRVLEVGVGSGLNLPLILRAIPKGMPVEVWGCDLSRGMIARARKLIDRSGMRSTDGQPPRILVADAHALPFPTASFDRVLHVGGIGAFQSPMRAMREMARVARPSSEVVVVDENLDPSMDHSLLHRIGFWSLTMLDPNPHPPREGIPYGSEIFADDQLSRFYYCLAFRTPPERAPRA